MKVKFWFETNSDEYTELMELNDDATDNEIFEQVHKWACSLIDLNCGFERLEDGKNE